MILHLDVLKFARIQVWNYQTSTYEPWPHLDALIQRLREAERVKAEQGAAIERLAARCDQLEQAADELPLDLSTQAGVDAINRYDRLRDSSRPTVLQPAINE